MFNIQISYKQKRNAHLNTGHKVADARDNVYGRGSYRGMISFVLHTDRQFQHYFPFINSNDGLSKCRRVYLFYEIYQVHKNQTITNNYTSTNATNINLQIKQILIKFTTEYCAVPRYISILLYEYCYYFVLYTVFPKYSNLWTSSGVETYLL